MLPDRLGMKWMQLALHGVLAVTLGSGCNVLPTDEEDSGNRSPQSETGNSDDGGSSDARTDTLTRDQQTKADEMAALLGLTGADRNAFFEMLKSNPKEIEVLYSVLSTINRDHKDLIAELRAALTELKDVRAHEKKIADLKKQLKEALATIATKNAELAALKEENLTQAALIAQLNDSIDALNADVAAKQSEINRLTTSNQELTNTIQSNETRIAELDLTIAAQLQALQDLRDEINTLENTVADNEAAIAAKDAELARLRQLVDERDAVIAEHLQTIRGLRADIEEMETVIAENTATIKGKDEEIATLNQQVKDRDATIASLKSAIEQRDEAIADLEAKNEALSQSVAQLQGEKAQLQDLVGILEQKLANAEVQRRYYQELIKKFVAEIRYMTGYTDRSGQPLDKIYFADLNGQQISKKIIAKGSPTGLRVIGQYASGYPSQRDLTSLVRVRASAGAENLKFDSLSSYIVTGLSAPSEAEVITYLAGKRATLQLQVRTAETRYYFDVTDLHNNATLPYKGSEPLPPGVGVPTGVIGQLRVIEIMLDVDGSPIAENDVTNQVQLKSPSTDLVLMRSLSRLYAHGLFFGRKAGTYNLSIVGKSLNIALPIPIKPAEPVGLAFSNGSDYQRPEFTYCLSKSEASHGWGDMVFLGQHYPTRLIRLMSDCSDLDVTTHPSTVYFPESVAKRGVKGIVATAAGLNSISATHVNLRSLNKHTFRVKERDIVVAVSTNWEDRPEVDEPCHPYTEDPNDGTVGVPKEGFEKTMTFHTWTIEAGCHVKQVEFNDEDESGVEFSVSGSTGNLTGAFGEGYRQNVLTLDPARGIANQVASVSAAYSFTDRCSELDQTCLSSAQGEAVLEDLSIPGAEPYQLNLAYDDGQYHSRFGCPFMGGIPDNQPPLLEAPTPLALRFNVGEIDASGHCFVSPEVLPWADATVTSSSNLLTFRDGVVSPNPERRQGGHAQLQVEYTFADCVACENRTYSRSFTFEIPPPGPQPAEGHILFISIKAVSGDFGLNQDPAQFADAVCNGDANHFGIPGRYKALLTTAQASFMQRVEVSGPIYNHDRSVMYWENAAEMMQPSGFPSEPVQLATGEPYTNPVVTGGWNFRPEGTCDNWRVGPNHIGDVPYAIAGKWLDQEAGSGWAANERILCSQRLPFYCISQP